MRFVMIEYVAQFFEPWLVLSESFGLIAYPEGSGQLYYAVHTKSDIVCGLIQDWEMLVLQVLRYDICAVTPHDFVDLLLSRLPIGHHHATTVRQHTQTFIALCATGATFFLNIFSFLSRVSWVLFIWQWQEGNLACEKSTECDQQAVI